MSEPIVVSRRTTLAWFTAALSALPASAKGSSLDGTKWPEVTLPPVTARGYGVDPDLADPKVPWPLTMSTGELKTTSTLCDMILPADGEASSASAVGVPAFINEWVSAPYPNQQRDRKLIIAGLLWLDAESNLRSKKNFTEASNAQRAAICDDIAFKDKVKTGFETPARFFALMRRLTLRVYYSTEEGWAQIGYMGNTPSEGPYPGPSPEALAHLNKIIAAQGLA